MFRAAKSIFGIDESRGFTFFGRKSYFDIKPVYDGLLDALANTMQLSDNIISFMNRVKVIFEQKNTVLSGISANLKINNKRIVFSSRTNEVI
jgi:hypothetical protein